MFLCVSFYTLAHLPRAVSFLKLLKIISGHTVQLSVINISGITTAGSASQYKLPDAIYLVKSVIRCCVCFTPKTHLFLWLCMDIRRAAAAAAARWCFGTTLFWTISSVGVLCMAYFLDRISVIRRSTANTTPILRQYLVMKPTDRWAHYCDLVANVLGNCIVPSLFWPWIFVICVCSST